MAVFFPFEPSLGFGGELVVWEIPVPTYWVVKRWIRPELLRVPDLAVGDIDDAALELAKLEEPPQGSHVLDKMSLVALCDRA